MQETTQKTYQINRSHRRLRQTTYQAAGGEENRSVPFRKLKDLYTFCYIRTAPPPTQGGQDTARHRQAYILRRWAPQAVGGTN